MILIHQMDNWWKLPKGYNLEVPGYRLIDATQKEQIFRIHEHPDEGYGPGVLIQGPGSNNIAIDGVSVADLDRFIRPIGSGIEKKP